MVRSATSRVSNHEAKDTAAIPSKLENVLELGRYSEKDS